ncbi:MAG: DUF4124 domain-containing protein [Moraxellaceae bacterium]|nr:MAG: DUF4124 domain-containing protein [Moraxellaceae bacterium]
MVRESRFLAVTLMLVMSGMAQAAIYKTTDAKGNVVYTDSPSKEAKTVELPPLSIVPSLSAEQIAQANSTGTPATNQPANIRYQLKFVQPAADQTVRKPEPIGVNVNVQPALANGDNIAILLDGVVVASGTGVTISTEKMDRGAHSLAARVTNTAGRVVSEVSTTVYVQQNSVNSPATQANRARVGK